MEGSYRHFTLEERRTLFRLLNARLPIKEIAGQLGRHRSTIYREIARNEFREVRQYRGYYPVTAEDNARRRRRRQRKLVRDAHLRTHIVEKLKLCWSPEQIAGRLAQENGQRVVSHETIYRFVHAQIGRTNDYSWRLLLPRGKSRRGWRGRKGGSPASFIEGRVPVAERPRDAADRSTPGHWEADLILFARYGQAILSIHERHSRLLLAAKPPNKTADNIAKLLCALFTAIPLPLRHTVTFDNGTEFARHHRLHALGMATFFCDPHAPWQKGGIENAIGRMRRFIPRKTDLATLPEASFHALLRAYNNTPRKCLDYQTPAERFLQQVLHFECESTFRPSPE